MKKFEGEMLFSRESKKDREKKYEEKVKEFEELQEQFYDVRKQL